MDNELLYCGIENRTSCSDSSLYLSIFLSFKAKFVSQFSQELYKVESSNMVYICRMSDCIAGLKLRVIAFILLFLSFFLSFPIVHFNIKICVRVFSGIRGWSGGVMVLHKLPETVQGRIFKHGIHM